MQDQDIDTAKRLARVWESGAARATAHGVGDGEIGKSLVAAASRAGWRPRRRRRSRPRSSRWRTSFSAWRSLRQASDPKAKRSTELWTTD